MKLIILSAMGPKGEIGYKNRMPWDHLSEIAKEDMEIFKKKTLAPNSVVVMGRKTLESIS